MVRQLLQIGWGLDGSPTFDPFTVSTETQRGSSCLPRTPGGTVSLPRCSRKRVSGKSIGWWLAGVGIPESAAWKRGFGVSQTGSGKIVARAAKRRRQHFTYWAEGTHILGCKPSRKRGERTSFGFIAFKRAVPLWAIDFIQKIRTPPFFFMREVWLSGIPREKGRCD